MFLALLGLAMVGLLAAMVGDDSDSDADNNAPQDSLPDPVDPPVDPDDELDLGASITANQDGTFTVELGEDETGSLVAVHSTEESIPTNACCSFENSHSLRLYLVPQGTDLPESQQEYWDDYYAFNADRDEPVSGDETAAIYGLTLIEEFDLGDVGDIDRSQDGGVSSFWDTRVALPTLISSSEITYVDGGDSEAVLSDLPTFDGPEDAPYVTPTHGTDGDDVLAARGTATSGFAGDDSISGRAGDIRGGEGDDLIISDGSTIIRGGDDNDTIIAEGSEFILGGDGDDVMRLNDPDRDAMTLTARGDGGDDYIVTSGQTLAEGGNGDDTLSSTQSGNLSHRAAPTMTGGAGADTFQVMASDDGVYGGTPDDPLHLATITDFDAAEDTLVLSSNLPGPISATYAEGSVLLELGDGSFASVALGVESFDVNSITYADVEADVDETFANVPVLEPTATKNEDGSITIELPEGDTGSVFAAVVEATYPIRGAGGDYEAYEMHLYYAPEGTDLPSSYADFPDEQIAEDGRLYPDNMYSHLDLTYLGEWNLGSVVSDYLELPEDRYSDTRIAPPTLHSEANVHSVFVSMPSDSDDNIYVGRFYETTSVQDIPYSLPQEGTSGDDLLTGGSARISGGEGNDTIDAPNGFILEGEAGDDVINGGQIGVIDGGSGNDTITIDQPFYVQAGDGDDVVLGRSFDETLIVGGAGNDYIATNGDAQVIGGDGDDTITTLYDSDEAVFGAYTTGGEGSDTFQVQLPTDLPSSSADDPLRIATIADFDAAEDTLIIDTTLGTPTAVAFVGSNVTLSYADGSTLQILLSDVETFDPSTIIFSDVTADVDGRYAAVGA